MALRMICRLCLCDAVRFSEKDYFKEQLRRMRRRMKFKDSNDNMNDFMPQPPGSFFSMMEEELRPEQGALQFVPALSLAQNDHYYVHQNNTKDDDGPPGTKIMPMIMTMTGCCWKGKRKQKILFLLLLLTTTTATTPTTP